MEGHKERKIERTVKDEKRRQSNERKFKTIKYNWGMKTIKKKKKKTKDNVQNPIFAHCPLFFIFLFNFSKLKKKKRKKK